MIIKQHNKTTGFTLIELVSVIVILGILAAVAVPKFTNLQGSARAASIVSLAANLRSAAQLHHVQARLDADNGGLANGYSFNGIHFDQGYPVGISFADADGIPEIIEAMTINLNNYTTPPTLQEQIAQALLPANCLLPPAT